MLLLTLTLALSLATSIADETVHLVEIQSGVPGARFVPPYSSGRRAKALQESLRISTAPIISHSVSLTPNAPYAADGSHLSFWRPSFVIGTSNGGEAGINYWGKYQQGHVNVAFASATPSVLDCRLVSARDIVYKIYSGAGDVPRSQGKASLRAGHFLLLIAKSDAPLSVELWPSSKTEPLGIFGCDIGAIDGGLP